VTLIVPGETPCLRCLFPQPPATPLSCATLGVLGPLVGVTGAMQALEALKFLVGDGALETLAGRLWTLDARDMTTRVLQLTLRPGCAHRA
jgi:molybdopterin/thiamine biosynthesis adenylyltransferase